MGWDSPYDVSKGSVLFDYSKHKSHVVLNTLEESFKMHKMTCNMLANLHRELCQFSHHDGESSVGAFASSDFQGDKSSSECFLVPTAMHSKCLMKDLNSGCVVSSDPNSFENLILPKFVQDSFPIFVGYGELNAWLYDCEKFFLKYGISEHNKVFLASHYFKGEVELWYKEGKREFQELDWIDFKSILLLRFPYVNGELEKRNSSSGCLPTFRDRIVSQSNADGLKLIQGDLVELEQVDADYIFNQRTGCETENGRNHNSSQLDNCGSNSLCVFQFVDKRIDSLTEVTCDCQVLKPQTPFVLSSFGVETRVQSTSQVFEVFLTNFGTHIGWPSMKVIQLYDVLHLCLVQKHSKDAFKGWRQLSKLLVISIPPKPPWLLQDFRLFPVPTQSLKALSGNILANYDVKKSNLLIRSVVVCYELQVFQFIFLRTSDTLRNHINNRDMSGQNLCVKVPVVHIIGIKGFYKKLCIQVCPQNKNFIVIKMTGYGQTALS